MKKRYSTLQIKTEVKEKLDAFCDANGYKLSGFVEKLIESTIDWAPNAGYINAANVMTVSYVDTGSYYIDTGSYFSQYSQSYC